MSAKVVCIVVLLIPTIVFGLRRNSECVTPNQEDARCLPASSCAVIMDAVSMQDRDAIKFAQDSQCGYDNEPLICCGSAAHKLGRGSVCVTPNEETATCKPVASCAAILDAIKSQSPAAIDFAQNSQCGFDTEPLVCCGSTGYSSRSLARISPLLPDRSKCGLPKGSDRVVGGELTSIEEFPWMALLGYKNKDGTDAGFKCGGTLINEGYVLTAAHCVLVSAYQGFQLDYVRLGEWQIGVENDCYEKLVNAECADPVVDIKIVEKIPHPQYNRLTGSHDIAILRLENELDSFTDYIRPICLPQPDSPVPSEGTRLTVCGWGATENDTKSEYKLKVEVPLVSISTCSKKIKQRNITENLVCAGGEFGKDSCKGDSGGPLLGTFNKKIAGDKIQWYQEGIVSWGLHCGVQGYPAIYTRVSKYMNWILENMKEF